MFIVYSIYIHRLDGLLFFFLLPFWKTRVLGKCPNVLADKCHGEYLRFPRFKLVIKWEKAYQWGLSQLKNNRNQVFFLALSSIRKKLRIRKPVEERWLPYTHMYIFTYISRVFTLSICMTLDIPDGNLLGATPNGFKYFLYLFLANGIFDFV